MTTHRELQLDDLFKFNTVVFDPLTEVYKQGFFMRHFLQWPSLAHVVLAPNGQMVGYIFGKYAVDEFNQLGGHVCVLGVSPDYRRLGLGTYLMEIFAKQMELKRAWYVDLFVRESNMVAISLYETLGYFAQRIVKDYYEDAEKSENGYEMRKSLSPFAREQMAYETGREAVG